MPLSPPNAQEKADAERNLKSLTDDFVSQNQELIALKSQLFDATNKAKMFETDAGQLNEVVRNLREELGRSKKVISQSKQAKGMSLLQEENEGLQMQLSGLKDMLRQTMAELASLKDSSAGGSHATASGDGGAGIVRLYRPPSRLLMVLFSMCPHVSLPVVKCRRRREAAQRGLPAPGRCFSNSCREEGRARGVEEIEEGIA